MSVGVMKDYKLKQRNLRVSIHWVGLGTGTPKDRDELHRGFLFLLGLRFGHGDTSYSGRPFDPKWHLPTPVPESRWAPVQNCDWKKGKVVGSYFETSLTESTGLRRI